TQRNNITGLFLQSTDGSIPVGTRQINVLLNANYARGRVNDAYADNLSLVVTKVPEPSISGLLLVGTSCLMVWKLRRNNQIFQ
ncbi:MAG: PEP-CTERM sorting domain-containing protein, partial [Nostoc sp.]